MAIKKAPIIGAFQVNLYCDKCGKVMKRDTSYLVSYIDKPTYQYECECGHKETSTYCFPFQQIVFDNGKAEVIREEDIEGGM